MLFIDTIRFTTNEGGIEKGNKPDFRPVAGNSGQWSVASESEWRKPLHSARISRPRRSADRGSPGDALTVEDWETLVEEDGWVRDSARTETFPLSRTRD